ncbi:MAG: DUF1926 domain-containing protein [Treponema sp.]|nr:DUF1926 domain-containing protein [Treponema sp.]
MDSAKIVLILGSHAHLPYGAETGEFENIYARKLLPFVSALCKYPRIQAVLHYSGVLLHWVERLHPELFMLIEDMVARRQIEMLGGGFYEPMLPIIPLQDKIGQIELLTTYLRKQFGKRPQGCWIPDYAWEQGLVSPLAACGMNYTFLSERQFALAEGADCYTPCICEDQGKIISVFPVMQSLEAELAGKSVYAVLEDFSNNFPGKREILISLFPARINVMHDEPDECAWGRFFEELSHCENFVETVNPGRHLRGLKGLKKLYFPDSTGSENSVPPRRFINIHPEASGIYSKMIFTNMLINQLRGDKSRKLSAHEELWKAQGSALFCSTGRQGLHNNSLRNAAYSSLLEAERITREKSKVTPSLVSFDFNMDGGGEWLFQDVKINCYVQSTGGGIFELDYLPKTWNYLDTSGGRLAFADRLLPANAAAENLAPGDIKGARLCRSERYEPGDIDKVRRKLCLALAQAPDLLFGNVEIEKIFLLKKDTVSVGYSLANRGTEKIVFQFSPEIDLSLPGEGDAFVRFFACKTGSADTQLLQPLLRGADGLKIQDIRNEVQITLSASRPFDGRISPVYTDDDQGGAKLYQALCVMPLFPVTVASGESWSVEFTLKFSH